jgi:hypothetical protein
VHTVAVPEAILRRRSLVIDVELDALGTAQDYGYDVEPQPRHVGFGVRGVRQVAPTAEFLLDVVEAMDVGHAAAFPMFGRGPFSVARRRSRKRCWSGITFGGTPPRLVLT